MIFVVGRGIINWVLRSNIVRQVYSLLMGVVMAKIAEKKSKKVGKKGKVQAYKNRLGIVFISGDRVKLTDKAFKTHAKDGELFAGRELRYSFVNNILTFVPGYVVLTQKLGGYWTWHVDDLEKAR